MFIKNALIALRRRATLIVDKGRSFKSALVVALTTLMVAPSFAALPQAQAPAGVNPGDIPGLWQALLKAGINVVVLGIGAYAFYQVAMGGLHKWKEYRDGKTEVSEVKEYFIWGSIVLVVMIALLTIANGIL